MPILPNSTTPPLQSTGDQFLRPQFETYGTVLNKKARNEKVLPTLESPLQSLEEGEIRTTNIRASFFSGSSRGGRGGRGGRDK